MQWISYQWNFVTGCIHSLRWRHQMENISALLAFCAGNSPVTCEFPSQRPVTRSFAVYFDLSPNKLLSKWSRRWWFETPLRSFCRQCSDKRPQRKSGWANLLVFSVPGGPASVFITDATRKPRLDNRSRPINGLINTIRRWTVSLDLMALAEGTAYKLHRQFDSEWEAAKVDFRRVTL